MVLVSNSKGIWVIFSCVKVWGPGDFRHDPMRIAAISICFQQNPLDPFQVQELEKATWSAIGNLRKPV